MPMWWDWEFGACRGGIWRVANVNMNLTTLTQPNLSEVSLDFGYSAVRSPEPQMLAGCFTSQVAGRLGWRLATKTLWQHYKRAYLENQWLEVEGKGFLFFFLCVLSHNVHFKPPLSPFPLHYISDLHIPPLQMSLDLYITYLLRFYRQILTGQFYFPLLRANLQQRGRVLKWKVEVWVTPVAAQSCLLVHPGAQSQMTGLTATPGAQDRHQVCLVQSHRLTWRCRN